MHTCGAQYVLLLLLLLLLLMLLLLELLLLLLVSHDYGWYESLPRKMILSFPLTTGNPTSS